jgi:hypothetical protein
MEERVPSFNTEPVADSDKPNSILEAFLEHFGMDFWELVAEQTNLKSVQGTLHSLKTTAVEILHLRAFPHRNVILRVMSTNVPPRECKLYQRFIMFCFVAVGMR